MVIGTDELIFLFRGDDASLGYAHPEIIVELCSRSGTDIIPSIDWCSHLLYPEEGAEISFANSEIIKNGVKLWYHRNRPRHKI